MRTLKKSLCLVLALVFVLGLCTIGAGAAELSDMAQVNDAYKGAITVMNGLGIIEGYPDGTFQPTKNVTRAEAAKLVTYMVLGAKNAERVPDGDGGFSDVAGNWASKYINYCASRGYIKGMGDGTFNPSGNITGTQLAALLLRVAGYGIMGEYEGKGWDINAVSDALSYGIYEDAETEDFSAPATREETTLYFFNTLTGVIRVSYDVDLNDYVTTGVNAGTTFGTAVWNLAVRENGERIGGTTRTYQLTENQATGAAYTIVDGIKYAIETGEDLIGHQVDVYYRDVQKTDKDGTKYYDAYLVEDVSSIADKGTYYGDLYKNLYAANKDNDGVAFAAIPVWENYSYKTTPGVSIYSLAATDTVNAMKGLFTTQSLFIAGDIILGYDGKIIGYMSSDYTVDQVKAVGEVITLKGDASIEVKPENAYEGIAKNDYVTVHTVGTVVSLKPTHTETIDISQRSEGIFAGYYNFFGVSPKNFGSVAVPGFAGAQADVTAGSTVEFYMDSTGKYFALNIVSGAQAGAVYVVDAYNRNITDDGYDNTGVIASSPYVQCVNEKGEEVVYRMAKGITLATATSFVGQVCKVTLDSDGRATLSAAPTAASLNKATNYTSYLTGGGTYYVTSDTKVIYLSSKSGTGTGTQADLAIKTGKLTTGQTLTGVPAYIVTSGSSNNIVALWISGTAPIAVDSSYMFIAGVDYAGTGSMWLKAADGHMVVNDEQIGYYTVYIDGTVNNAAFLDSDTPGVLMPYAGSDYVAGNKFYQYEKDENNVYTIVPYTGSALRQITLSVGEITNGKLYRDADGVDISGIKVVNVTGEFNMMGTAANDGSQFYTIESVDDIESLLLDGKTVDVSYIRSSSNGKPINVIYVTGVK